MSIIGERTRQMEDFSLNIHVAYKCSLIGANLERADLRGKKLRGINLSAANMRGADLSYCDLRDATILGADFSRTCLYHTDLSGADVSGSDFSMSYGKAVKFYKTIAHACIFKNVIYKNALFIDTDLRKSDFFHAELLGSRFNGALFDRVRNMHTAQFEWWMSPWGGPQSYEPRPGWLKIDESLMGSISLQENTGLGVSAKDEAVLRTYSTEDWWQNE